MKFAFFFVSVICALCLSLLSYILATGRIPFRPEKPVEGAVISTNGVAEEAMSVLAEEKTRFDEVINSLEKERDAYEKKKAELEASQDKEKLKIKIDVLGNLKADLEKLRASLEEEISEIDENEKKNMEGLAEVYSKMDPANAAPILIEMEKRRAAIILSLMGDRQAAGVLDAVTEMGDDSTKIAVEWSDIIRKLKTGKTGNAEKEGTP